MQIEWTDEAQASLDQIVNWVAEKFSPKVAIEVMEAIVSRAGQLQFFPYSGMMDPLFKHLDRGHRFVMKEYSRIVYYIERDTIVISNVFDVRMNPWLHYNPGRGK